MMKEVRKKDTEPSRLKSCGRVYENPADNLLFAGKKGANDLGRIFHIGA